ncbi:pirin family protein [Nocardioides sambongensis]|uniref:pirin family protein n=1 Tax=Nocardioides sambongensis TaxID=2589074 RepID=UPI0015E834D8|nr:pirin family protein [Nocardioides sambongensis]
MSAEIRRGDRRFTEREPGRLTRHAFSFGSHYDPDRLAFGPLVCHDDHLLGAGRGFAEHPHSALDIVTWVVSGEVRHVDGLGNEVVLGAGACGVLHAGSGVRHSELAGDGAARFVQTWLTADDATSPAYAHHTPQLAAGAGLVRLAGAADRAGERPGGDGLPLTVAGAAYDIARLDAGETLTLPAGPRVHAFVATGALLRSSLAEPLQAGDAFALVDEAEHEVTAAVPTDLLVWSFA